MSSIRRAWLAKMASLGALLVTGMGEAHASEARGESAAELKPGTVALITDLGVRPGLLHDQTTAIQAAIDHCAARGIRQLFWPMSAGQVYRVDGSINARQLAFVGDGGPLKTEASGFTFEESRLKSCIYLRGKDAQIIDLTVAEGLAVVCNRSVQRTHAIIHTRRLQWHSRNFAVHHAGADGLHLPYGCIHWYFGQASEVTRSRRYGIYLSDLDDGAGAPDTDSNIVVCDGGRLTYNRQGNFYFKGSGGVFDFHGGFDLTKAGEPDESGMPDSSAFAVTIRITKGTNSTSFSFRDGWMEKNCNLFDISGTIKNISIERLRIAAYEGNRGVMFRLAGYVYNLHARQIGYSGPRYAYLFDAAALRLDPATANNGIRIDSSVEGYLQPCNSAHADNLRLLRAIGGFVLQTFPAGTVRSSAMSNDGAGGHCYMVDLVKLPSRNAVQPIAMQPGWHFNNAQALDVSLIVGGQYAGEIRNANAAGWVAGNRVAVGDGSVLLYVRQKIQTEAAFPKSYVQNANVIT